MLVNLPVKTAALTSDQIERANALAQCVQLGLDLARLVYIRTAVQRGVFTDFPREDPA